MQVPQHFIMVRDGYVDISDEVDSMVEDYFNLNVCDHLMEPCNLFATLDFYYI